MPKYGQLVDGQLFTSLEQLDGYKPISYERIPEFDQTTHYVSQSIPMDNGDHIYVSVEVKELTNVDEGGTFDEMAGFN